MPASSSDENSNWEDDSSVDEAPVTTSKEAKPAAKAGAPAQKQTKNQTTFEIPAHLAHELDDPNEERARLQKLALLRDRHLSGNMFGDSSDDDDDDDEEEAAAAAASPKNTNTESRAQKILKVAKIGNADPNRLTSSGGAGGGDPLRSIQVARLADIEKLCDVLCPKIVNSVAKSPVWLILLDRLLQSCACKMDPQDLTTLGRKVHSATIERKRALNFQSMSSKKGDPCKVDIRNPRAELDIAAGIGASDYSESDEQQDDGDFGM